MEEKPMKLGEEDRLKLCLQMERSRRFQAELQNLHVAMQQIQAQVQKSQAEQQVLGEEIRKKYQIDPQDSVNSETGLIVRGKPTEPPAAYNGPYETPVEARVKEVV